MDSNVSRKSSLPSSSLCIRLQSWSSLYAKDQMKKQQLLKQGFNNQQANALAYVHQKRYYDKVKHTPEFKKKKNEASRSYYQKIKNDPVKYKLYLEKRKEQRLKKRSQ